MKKIILIIFLFFILPAYLFTQNIQINSEFFSKDRNLIHIIIHNYHNTNEIKSKINDYFNHNGYVFTKVKIITYATNKLLIDLDEGKIKELRITCRSKICSPVISNYLYFKPGNIFNKNKFRLQLKKLFKPNYSLISIMKFHQRIK